jgi:hypothetical protein
MSDTEQLRRWPHWVLEAALIVASVLLGFALAEFGAYRSDRQLAVRALANIEAELEHNLTSLEPFVPLHQAWAEALLNPASPRNGQAAIDVWFETRPDLPSGVGSPFPFLSQSAWDAALDSGVLRLFEYEVSQALSEVYRLQEIAGKNVDRLAEGALSLPSTFDPSSRDVSIRLLWLTLADIQSAEALLLGLYRTHLPLVRSAVER